MRIIQRGNNCICFYWLTNVGSPSLANN
jgi:hypothetical protein